MFVLLFISTNYYEGGEKRMPEVKVGENESIEVALRRFKRKFKKQVLYLKLKNVKDTKNQALKET